MHTLMSRLWNVKKTLFSFHEKYLLVPMSKHPATCDYTRIGWLKRSCVRICLGLVKHRLQVCTLTVTGAG